MARGETERIRQLKQQLRLRLSSDLALPGEPFFSSRQLARDFKIAYQTAHRVLAALEREGLIRRQQGKPTVVAGPPLQYRSVALVFAERAQRPHSFGARLLALLTDQLDKEGIQTQVIDSGRIPDLPPGRYPVFWEVPVDKPALLTLNRHALFLNEKPVFGLATRLVDSLILDDFAGGMAAGELLAEVFRCHRVAALGGPPLDPRSQNRIDGLLRLFPKARVMHAGTWEAAVPDTVLKRMVRHRPDGLFCVNDRLAARVKAHYQCHDDTPPAIVGFDDAPIAQLERISTIAIPWQGFVAEAVSIIRNRLQGSYASGQHRMVACQAVLRG
ncbi:MAG: GntR family transcriptional regulator [Opitutales bacterium]